LPELHFVTVRLRGKVRTFPAGHSYLKVGGDTLKVDPHGKVSLIGIDTSEREHPKKDRYGRLLAYLHLSGARMLNRVFLE
jgi:endonuclease YncB( thermonuclease family)